MDPPDSPKPIFWKLLHILLMIFDVLKISLSAFGLQGSKFKMAARVAGGLANLFPIAPILISFVSKV